MSVTGRPVDETLDARGLRLGIVAAQWHHEIADCLLERAVTVATKAGVVEPTVVRAPGSLELAVITQELVERHDAVVALGVVLRGDTPHFHYVCDAVTTGLARVALDARKPVANGVLMCHTVDQALARCGWPDSPEDKGGDACRAALQAALALRGLRGE